MEKLDPSTKKQLNLLLAKTVSASTPKQPKLIVSTVPLAQIRKTMLKKGEESDLKAPSPVKAPSPTKSTSKLSPSKSSYELSSPSKSNYDFSPCTKSKLSPSKSVFSLPSDVPMDKILIPLMSPKKMPMPLKFENEPGTGTGSPMKIDKKSNDIFLECESEEEIDDEIILNVPNVIKSSTAQKEQKEVEVLTNELPQKITFSNRPSRLLGLACSSSPSVSSRIKSLGLVAGTPLRAFYQNSSNPEIFEEQEPNKLKFNYKNEFYNSSSLLNDLIEEFCNTKDEECFKKILSLTSMRTSDFDGLTSNLVQKLLISSIGNIKFDNCLKLLKNILNNESYLLSSSGREVIEILEEQFRNNPENIETSKFLVKTNLVPILIENCIEMCCERLSEFKLILLSDFIRNFIGTNLKDILIKSMTPLILVNKKERKFYLFINSNPNPYINLGFKSSKFKYSSIIHELFPSSS